MRGGWANSGWSGSSVRTMGITNFLCSSASSCRFSAARGSDRSHDREGVVCPQREPNRSGHSTGSTCDHRLRADCAIQPSRMKTWTSAIAKAIAQPECRGGSHVAPKLIGEIGNVVQVKLRADENMPRDKDLDANAGVN